MGLSIAKAKKQQAAEDRGLTIEVKDASGVVATHGDPKKPVTVKVAGTYSERYRQADRDFIAQATDTRALGENRVLYLAAACVMEWDGFYEDEAETKPLPCTVDNVRMFLDADPGLFAQVYAKQTAHADFFAASSAG